MCLIVVRNNEHASVGDDIKPAAACIRGYPDCSLDLLM